MLRENLERLKEKLIESASLVSDMIEKSIRGLIEKDENLLSEVTGQDEGKENALEIEIDEICIYLIACYQPQATDLRTIIMMLKMNNDLERIGDEAVNISESAIFLIDKPEVKPLIDIPKMAEQATSMLSDTLKALIEEDTQLAHDVCRRDDVVDGLRDQIIKELSTFMAANPNTIDRSLRLIRISRSLERISDLCTNICEDVIYMLEGRTIKHHHSI